jgi:hypothetical protein
LNVTQDSEVIASLRVAGFEHSHVNRPGTATCNPNLQAKMIDFIFYNSALLAEPLALPAVGDETRLPGPVQPSDHVAVRAKLKWRE